MNKTNQLVTIIISSFVTAFKNNRLNGLEFNFDFEPMKEVCEFFDAKPVGAYGCFTFELDGKTIFVYSTYGDSDAAEHDEEENEDGMVYGIVSMGFCFYLDQFMYCFDLDECGTIVRFFKTVKPFTGSPDMFSGKRPFYHYRDKQSLSMQGFDKALNLDEHVEARKWTSGPRTQFDLEKFALL